MDISKIDDEDRLKSLAYDQMVQLEQAQYNLTALNKRIKEVNDAKVSNTKQ